MKPDKTECFENEKESLLDEVPSSTTNWDDYPEPAPPKATTPVPHVDANARSTSARIADQPDASVCSEDARTAAQYAEERTSHVQWQPNGAAMQVESTDFPIQNVELMQSNSIQTAYAPIPMPTQHSEDLSLRWSNVDGNFYSHEFDHEKVIEVMDESASQISSVDRPWKTRVFETQPRRVRPDPVQIPPLQSPNGSLRERSPPRCTCPGVS